MVSAILQRTATLLSDHTKDVFQEPGGESQEYIQLHADAWTQREVSLDIGTITDSAYWAFAELMLDLGWLMWTPIVSESKRLMILTNILRRCRTENEEQHIIKWFVDAWASFKELVIPAYLPQHIRDVVEMDRVVPTPLSPHRSHRDEHKHRAPV